MAVVDWLAIGAKLLRQGGAIAAIFRTQSLSEALAMLEGKFGAVEILPIHSKTNEAAKRVLVRAIKGRKTPTNILPGLVVHQEDGAFTAKAEAIFTGAEKL